MNHIDGIFSVKKLNIIKIAVDETGCEVFVKGSPGDVYQENGLFFTVLHGYKRLLIRGDIALFLNKFNSLDTKKQARKRPPPQEG